MRINLLKDLERKCDRYKSENPFSADAHFSSGKVKVLLAEALMPASFERLFESDALDSLSIEVRQCFFEAIKDLKKGQALNDGKIDDRNLMLLAKAIFLAGYYVPHEIVQLLADLKKIETLTPEEKRLYATIHVLGGNEAKGFHILKSDSEAGSPLFFATIYRLTGKNTEAIIEYRKALEKVDDIEIKTLIHFNLGKIYFSQSLAMEAAKEFSEAVAASPQKAYLKIWAGKSYAALGDVLKAQEMWRDALKLEPENVEAKKLIMGK
ncbi:MAG: hypothetical protein N2316_03225 [Spirochaetes bacterium]|nr:hypothetical protein [Spirochaetota bacterium]